MKKLRSIHLFFIVFIIGVIVCFWMGYLFGSESQRQEDLAMISEANLKADYYANKQYNLQTENAEENLSAEKYSMETGLEYKQPAFYIKESDQYLAVFVAATDELYFETDIALEDLPVELAEDLEEGIEFTDLEAVYTFLENYSS